MNHLERIFNPSERGVMAIVNVTDDSFYDASRMFSEEAIRRRVNECIEQGASIIDVGGYSSRPGADDISVEEEWQRVARGLKVIKEHSCGIAISVDTFRSEIVRRAVEMVGKVVVNDISAGEIDPEIVDAVAEYDLPYVAMHMRGRPQTMQLMTDYRGGVCQAVCDYFTERVEQLRNRGVQRLILDPGFGFAKSVEQNFELLGSLSQLCKLGYPVLVGLSRKSMIYRTLNITPQESLAGTIALNWEALRQGATILRGHDVREARQVIELYEKTISCLR